MSTNRERAAVLREAGLGYNDIARYLGVGIGTVYRWINPEHEKHQRAVSLAWKDRNREANRARDRQHLQDIKDPCPNCGTLKSHNRAQCLGCFTVTAEVRRTLAEGMWADGWLIREINDALGWTAPGGITSMRPRGWDLPHRYRMENGRRVAA